jgi:RES domain-containing protein
LPKRCGRGEAVEFVDQPLARILTAMIVARDIGAAGGEHLRTGQRLVRGQLPGGERGGDCGDRAEQVARRATGGNSSSTGCPRRSPRMARAPSDGARPAPADRTLGDQRRGRAGRGFARAHRARRLYVTPLPPPLNPAELVAWRLDGAKFAGAWDSGAGAFRFGGRWNSRGVRAVYCSLDPATAILEVAAHTGFDALDTVPHVLTAATITDVSRVHVVEPVAVPDSGWLRPGNPSAGQQAFGDTLLARHGFIAIPSAVSSHSWNLVFVASVAAGGYARRLQEAFALDPRLSPPSL